MARSISTFAAFCVTIAMILMLSGCMGSAGSSGISALTTGSIEPVAKSSSKQLDSLDILPLTEEQVLDDELSDQRAILEAVRSAEVKLLDGAPVKWQNDQTGSTGLISSLVHRTESQGRNCRNFDVLRSSFDGVLLYKASACHRGDNIWLMERFAVVEAEG